MHPDVIIIGAGIVGGACAYYLSRMHLQVHLLERGAVGSGASKAGMTHIVTWEEPEPHLQLAALSKALYRELSQELPLDIQYRETGSLAIVEEEAGLPAFAQKLASLQNKGAACQLLSREELLEREPCIASDVAGGGFFAGDAQVNPLVATQALAQAARRYGATLQTFTEAAGLEIDPAGGQITAVITRLGRIPTQNVVIAAGAWSAQVGRLAGLEIPITPRKGTLAVTAPVSPELLRCKILLAAGYMEAVKDTEAYGAAIAANLQQTQNGNLLLGSSRQFAGFDASVDPRLVSSMLARSLRLFPFLERVSAIRLWSGFRPYTPDLLPIISPVPDIPGLYVAAGHEGLGITEAPITGKLISQMIAGQPTALPVEPFALSRFTAHAEI